jgi:hypothetical protein
LFDIKMDAGEIGAEELETGGQSSNLYDDGLH